MIHAAILLFAMGCAQRAPAEDPVEPALGSLIFREHRVEISSTPAGVRYDVYDHAGRLVVEGADQAAASKVLPGLEQHLAEAWAGAF